MDGWGTWTRGEYRGPTHRGQVERAEIERSTSTLRFVSEELPSLIKRDQQSSFEKVRYFDGFPHLMSDTAVLEHSISPMLSCLFLSFPTYSGHKSGHTLLWLIDSTCQPNPGNSNTPGLAAFNSQNRFIERVQMIAI